MNQFDNFYNFVNMEWFKKEIPDEYSKYGTFEEMQEKIDANLINILDNLEPITHEIQLIKHVYAQAFDDKKRDELGTEPLNKIFNMIDNIKTINDIYKTLGKLSIIGFDIFFNLYTSEDIKSSSEYVIHLSQQLEGLPSKEYFFNDNYKDIIPLYKQFINEIGKEINISDIDIYEFEKEIANISLNNEEKRDVEANYIKTNINDILKEIPDMRDYFLIFRIIKPNIQDFYNKIILDNLAYFKNLNFIIKRYNIEFIKKYFKIKILIKSSNYLNSKIFNIVFNFHGKIISGRKKPREKKKIILYQISEMLGEILGDLYIKKYYNDDIHKQVINMCNLIFNASKIKILSCSWLDIITKKNAIHKIKNIKCKVGYPTKLHDYSKLFFNNLNFYEILLISNLFYNKIDFDKLSKPIDRDEWLMNCYDVNAYYNPLLNEIVIPAGICISPFFDINKDLSINLGGLGTTIAHEISHAFDDQGRKFDLYGNINNWWTKNDEEKYNRETKKLIRQFNDLQLLNINISGLLTLGENIADYSGVSITIEALKMALRDKQDISQDLLNFFVSYAQTWKQKIRTKQLIKSLTTDVHAPAIFRTNQILSNIPEFYKLFNIKKNHPMYIKKKHRIKLW